jgi:hypothetical protein
VHNCDVNEEQLRRSYARNYSDDDDVPEEQLRHSGALVPVCMVGTSMTMSLKSSSDARMPVTTQMTMMCRKSSSGTRDARVHGMYKYDDVPEEQLRRSYARNYSDGR